MWLKNVSGTGLGFEGSHDAWKMMNAGGQPNLYSCELDEKLAINALDFKTIRSVQVGLEEAIDGTPFVMHLDQVVNDQWYQVYLEDKYLNQITNISAMDYSFTSMPAVQAGPRFVLHFDQAALNSNEPGSAKALVYQSGDRIIITGTDASEYRIVSIDGRLIAQGTLHESSSSIAAPPKAGVYLVQLFGAKTQSERLIIQ